MQLELSDIATTGEVLRSYIAQAEYLLLGVENDRDRALLADQFALTARLMVECVKTDLPYEGDLAVKLDAIAAAQPTLFPLAAAGAQWD